jgi:hypothetical protein
MTTFRRFTLRMTVVILLIPVLVGCGSGTPTVSIWTNTPAATQTPGALPATASSTASPVVTSSAATPTRESPTLSIDNPHGQFPAFSVVNINHTLSGQPNVECWDGTGQIDGAICEDGFARIVAYPNGWQPVVYMGSTNLPAFVHNKPGGYQFEVSWINGRFGLAQSVTLYGNQRYIVKMIYSTSLRYQDGISAPIDVGGTIWNSDGGTRTDLTPRPVPLTGRHEIVWVVETDTASPTIFLELYVILNWPQLVGTVTFEYLSVETAPPGYGDDAVIHF